MLLALQVSLAVSSLRSRRKRRRPPCMVAAVVESLTTRTPASVGMMSGLIGGVGGAALLQSSWNVAPASAAEPALPAPWDPQRPPTSQALPAGLTESAAEEIEPIFASPLVTTETTASVSNSVSNALANPATSEILVGAFTRPAPRPRWIPPLSDELLNDLLSSPLHDQLHNPSRPDSPVNPVTDAGQSAPPLGAKDGGPASTAADANRGGGGSGPSGSTGGGGGGGGGGSSVATAAPAIGADALAGGAVSGVAASGSASGSNTTGSDGSDAPRQHGQISRIPTDGGDDSFQSLQSLQSSQSFQTLSGTGGSGGGYANYTPGTHDYCDVTEDMTQNGVPVAVADGDPTPVTTPEDTAVTIDVLLNDSDPDSQTPFVTGATDGANGQVIFRGENVTYVPNANWHGTDSFTYTIQDGYGGSATASVNVSVSSVEDMPVVKPDQVVTPEGGSVTIPVLANDSDAEGPLTLSGTDFQSVYGGTLTIDAGDPNNPSDDAVVYEPDYSASGGSGGSGGSGHTGWDYFTYQVTDAADNVASGTVSVYVHDPDPDIDDPPVGFDDFPPAIAEDSSPVTVNVLGNDWDDGQKSVSHVSGGMGAAVNNGDGTVTYTPPADFYGTASILVQIQDDHTDPDGNPAPQYGSSTLEITVTPVNDQPVAVDDPPDPDPNDPDVPAIPVWTGASVVVSTLANDTDVEIDAGSSTQSLTVTGASQGMKGKVIFTAESVTYVPDPDQSGTDSFTYTVADGAGKVAVGTVQIEIYRLDLDIYNGQGAASPVPEEKEECVGAFTVANLNDTDGDDTDGTGPADNADMNGVVATPSGRDEVDLMKLVLRKPVPFEGGMVTLSVSGSVALWEESTKQTSIALTNGEAQFDLTGGDKKIWVELTAASESVRDVGLDMSYVWPSLQVGNLVSVKATGIWATMTDFQNTNTGTTLTNAAINSNPGSNQIEVTNPAGFAVGDYITIFSAAGDGVPRKAFEITLINDSILSLDDTLQVAWAQGDQVREGLSPDADRGLDNIFMNTGGGKLGAAHVSPMTNNGMEMEFTVQPSGIGDEPGIVFDITRQKESFGWAQDGGVWAVVVNPGVVPSSFPTKVEEPNDDKDNSLDEDTSPENNHIYSVDTPGNQSDIASHDREVLRLNFYEFVRVIVNGGAFANDNGVVEGSRASEKVAWRSRMDVVEDAATGKWDRNDAQPPGEVENEIEIGHKPLLQNDPT